jgi:hypothetical protein
LESSYDRKVIGGSNPPPSALDNLLKIPQTKIAMRSARTIFFLLVLSVVEGLLFALLFFVVTPSKVQAQTYPTPTPAYSPPLNQFTAPNVDSNVPQNQHTFVQSVTIEVVSALICQITGIDPIDPSQGCLGVNPQTRKLGLVKPPVDENGIPQLGGMLGATTDMIAMTYQAPATTGLYTQYLADNFGLVKKAHAQVGYAFDGLRPILELWKAVRNIAYILLTLAFVFIGIGVMLRVKIDPRTVMTIQNQIPKVIIAIILITLSYAIAALLIDLMWVTTYAGINLLSDHYPKAGETLAVKAGKVIINNPLSFTNQIFETPSPGVFHITQQVSNNVGELLRNVMDGLFGTKPGDKCFGGVGSFFPGGKKFIDGAACAAGVLAFLASITLKLVILVVLMVTLFKIWFNLIKAYIYTILYVIVSPVMIVFGLLPSKPMGFENWLRRLFVNIAVFPLTAFLIVAARLLMDLYNADKPLFVPPLVGNPQTGLNFGAIMAFGALLITPHLQVILQEKMGVKGIGSPGLIGAGIAGGAAVLGAPVGRAMKSLNRYDPRTGDIGMLAKGKRDVAKAGLGIGNKMGIGMARRKLERTKILEQHGNLYGAEGQALLKKSNRQLRQEARAERGGNPRTGGGWFSRRQRNRSTGGEEPTATAPDGGTDTTPRVGVFRRAGRGVGRLGRRITGRADRDERGSSTPTIIGSGKPKEEGPSTPHAVKEGTDFKMHSTVAPGTQGHLGDAGKIAEGATGSTTAATTVQNLTVNAANVRLIDPDLSGLSEHMAKSTENQQHVQKRYAEEADKVPQLRGKGLAELLAPGANTETRNEAKKILKQIEEEIKNK